MAAGIATPSLSSRVYVDVNGTVSVLVGHLSASSVAARGCSVHEVPGPAGGTRECKAAIHCFPAEASHSQLLFGSPSLVTMGSVLVSREPYRSERDSAARDTGVHLVALGVTREPATSLVNRASHVGGERSSGGVSASSRRSAPPSRISRRLQSGRECGEELGSVANFGMHLLAQRMVRGSVQATTSLVSLAGRRAVLYGRCISVWPLFMICNQYLETQSSAGLMLAFPTPSASRSFRFLSDVVFT